MLTWKEVNHLIPVMQLSDRSVVAKEMKNESLVPLFQLAIEV